MNLPRVMLAAGASGSGKTLLTCGLLQALVDRKYKIASFKCGPDFIDPMFHTQVIGTKSRNLDTFFTDPARTRYLLGQGGEGMDLAVMEGVMGFYDGVGGTTSWASAYDLSRVTETPVLLIVNARGMSLSLAAYVKGFLEYRKDSQIKGVIFNQMSPMLYPRMKQAIEAELPVKVYGYVPKVTDCRIESRHLGLLLPHEVEDLKGKLQKLAGILEDTLDIDGILELAAGAPPVAQESLPEEFSFTLPEPVRLGVARDEAFCFFYEDNLQLLARMGAELVDFSPLHDSHLPENLDGLLLSGGYPELYVKELEANASLREEIGGLLEKGIPCLAECGGFLYLHQELEGMDGSWGRGVGYLPGKAYRTPKLNRFGYVTLETEQEVFGTQPGPVPAHEFHYFDSECCGETFTAKKPQSSRSWRCIHGDDRHLIGFPHLYYYGNPRIPQGFLRKCLEYKKER